MAYVPSAISSCPGLQAQLGDEGGERDHEQSRVPSTRQFAERLRLAGVGAPPDDAVGLADIGDLGRPRERQPERRPLGLDGPAPPLELVAVERAVGAQPPALPRCEVGVLEAFAGLRQRVASAMRPVGASDVLEEDLPRHPVGDDVVIETQQAVVVVRRRERARPSAADRA